MMFNNWNKPAFQYILVKTMKVGMIIQNSNVMNVRFLTNFISLFSAIIFSPMKINGNTYAILRVKSFTEKQIVKNTNRQQKIIFRKK